MARVAPRDEEEAADRRAALAAEEAQMEPASYDPVVGPDGTPRRGAPRARVTMDRARLLAAFASTGVSTLRVGDGEVTDAEISDELDMLLGVVKDAHTLVAALTVLAQVRGQRVFDEDHTFESRLAEMLAWVRNENLKGLQSTELIPDVDVADVMGGSDV